ncbi:MAG: leucine-rich repeat domain-containing protein [Limisphaerales bacterium]
MKGTIHGLLVLLLLTLPAAVQAQYVYSTNTDGSVYAYTTNADGSANIAGYTGPPWVVAIPANINGLTVTSVGYRAFFTLTSLTSVTIPDSVNSIGKGAFAFCSSLASVIIPGSVTNIGTNAFYNCSSLTGVYFTGNPPAVGTQVFALDGNATAYYFPGTTGWSNTFAGLPVVEIPYDFTINSDETITITGYLGSAGVLTIPTTIGGLPVTVIGGYAFCEDIFDIDPTSITVPNSVTSFDDYAFFECYGLTNLMIGSGVTNIGSPVFLACFSLDAITVDPSNSFFSSVNGVLFNKSQSTLVQYPLAGIGGSYTIPSNVTSIGSAAFEDCGNLTNIAIPAGVTNIEDAAFAGAGLTSVTIPSLPSIGDSVFAGCPLTSVTIPNSVTSIGDAAFEGCPLTSVTIPNSVTNLGGSVFDDCGDLTNVTIGNRVTSIGDAAFYCCFLLTSVIIPDSVTNIGSEAFHYCAILTNVTIGAGVTSIGDYAFQYCALSGVYFQGNAPTADSSVFDAESGAAIYYLSGTTGWSNTFAGRPAVLWNPLIEASGAGFGVRSNRFGFNITGTTNIPIMVEACANLASPVWTALTNANLTNGLFYFSDPQWTNYPARYYRISSP